MKRFWMAIATLGLGLAQAASAQTDIQGSEDHPLISRMPGTHIVGYHYSDYQEFMIATGPMGKDPALPPVERFEGQSTVITYLADDKSLSALAIFRNFETAFSRAGFETVFTCRDDECGAGFVRQLYWNGDPQRQGQNPRLDAPNRIRDRHTFHYWSGTAETGQGSYVISLLVAQHAAMGFPASVVLDISVPTALDDERIEINSETMRRDIETKGHVVLDGLFFDFDEATLMPESKPALAVIADYLKANPALKVFVVGHTDAKGTVAYNRDLSQARADTVRTELSAVHNIPAEQMQAIGVGPAAPRTSNATEKGRALNRRVELVAQQ